MKRRDFIKNISVIGGVGTAAFSFGSIPLNAFSNSLINLKSTNGRILVLLQLSGGNDGLNTVIPFEDSIYFSKRPNLNIPKNNVIQLNSLTGLHPSLQKLKDIYDQGKLCIVQNVGYENPNRSHFRSTDIWLTASDSTQYLYDGWSGRHILKEFPNYPNVFPEQPMSIQLGSVQSLLFETQYGSVVVAFEDPNSFYQLVSGSTADPDPPPNTLPGIELKFLKQIAAQSIQYATVIKQKADAGQNKVTYPNTKLGLQLSIIVKLISGGLTTPVYLTSLGGFDTHANQLTSHASLLTQIADAVSAFQKDLELNNVADKVLLMTFSEFGRRVNENGSAGTDHGTAAPMFIIGTNVNGGIIGSNPNLSNLDPNGDIKYVYDYRQLYATMLKNHFGRSDNDIQSILLRNFNVLPIIKNPASVSKDGTPISYSLKQNFPNPFNPVTKINYTIANPGNVNLKVFDNLGKEISTLVNNYHSAGEYSVLFNGQAYSSGVYIYKLEVNGFSESRKMILVK